MSSLRRGLLAKLATIGIASFLLSLLPFGSGATPAFAAVSSTQGTEFYVTFDRNLGVGELFLYLSGSSTGTATITWPNGSTESFPVSAGTVTTVTATSKNVINTSSEGIAKTSALIQSTVPISVYGANVANGTSDAFVALPSDSLGREYRLLSWPVTITESPARVSVIATESGTTTISVTPTTELNVNPANVTYTKTLQQGEVYTVQTPATSGADITGTLVSSDKKIVVVSSHGCINFTLGACDHIVEYMPPVTSWGQSFITPGSLNTARGDFYRVLAHQDATVVRVDGVEVATLNAGQFYAFTGTVTGGVQGVNRIETSKPVLVGQGLQSGSYGTTLQSGDPALSLVAPTLQFLSGYTVATPASGFAVNSIVVIAKTADTASVRVGGNPVSPFVAIPNTDYSYIRVEVAPGSYSVTSNSGIGVYVAGFNSVNSYAYPGGFAMVNLIENPGGVESVLGNTGGDSGDGSGAATAESRIAFDVRAREGRAVEGTIVDMVALDLPANCTYVLRQYDPATVLVQGDLGGARNLNQEFRLPGGLAAGSYTLEFAVECPGQETLALHRTFDVSAEGTFASVGTNVVGLKTPPEAPERLAYTGVSSTTLPWWALSVFLMGMLLLAYSVRARHIVQALEAQSPVRTERTPWEILSTPIRVPGIDYVPGSRESAPRTPTLADSLHELDVAISILLVRRLDKFHAAFSGRF